MPFPQSHSSLFSLGKNINPHGENSINLSKVIYLSSLQPRILHNVESRYFVGSVKVAPLRSIVFNHLIQYTYV